MRFESVGIRVPSRKVADEDILHFLKEHSNGAGSTMVIAYQRLVKGLFNSSIDAPPER